MSNTNFYLHRALDTVVRWGLDSSNNIVATIKKPGVAKEIYQVSDVDLHALHPRMPEVVRAMVIWTKTNKNQDEILGEEFFAQLDILQHGLIELETRRGELETFSHISNLIGVEGENEMVELTGTTVTLDYVQLAGERTPIVVSTLFWAHNVSKAEIDKKYPGWNERRRIGQDIGMAHGQLMRMVFSHDDAVRTSLPLPDSSFE